MCRTEYECHPGYGRDMDEQQHSRSHSDQRRGGDGCKCGRGHTDLYADIGRMQQQHEFYGLCESHSTGGGDHHTAHMYDPHGECYTERTACHGKLDVDPHPGRRDLYGERHQLYGERLACRDDLYLYSDQQQRVHFSVFGQCGDQRGTGWSCSWRGR